MLYPAQTSLSTKIIKMYLLNSKRRLYVQIVAFANILYFEGEKTNPVAMQILLFWKVRSLYGVPQRLHDFQDAVPKLGSAWCKSCAEFFDIVHKNKVQILSNDPCIFETNLHYHFKFSFYWFSYVHFAR